MFLEVMRSDEKGFFFGIREKDGGLRWRVRKVKWKMRETWEITNPYDPNPLAVLVHSHKGIMPGCVIRLADGNEICLWQKPGFKGDYGIDGCGLKGETGKEHPFVLKKGGEVIAWISLINPGKKKAYDIWAERENLFLCISILTAYMLCSKVD